MNKVGKILKLPMHLLHYNLIPSNILDFHTNERLHVMLLTNLVSYHFIVYTKRIGNLSAISPYYIYC
jgi:hypothetical protein